MNIWFYLSYGMVLIVLLFQATINDHQNKLNKAQNKINKSTGKSLDNIAAVLKVFTDAAAQVDKHE